MTWKHLGAGLLLLISATGLWAQKTNIYQDKDAAYKDGLELFDKKLYVAAEKSFIDYMGSAKATSLLKIDAEYYAAACAIELFHKDGEWRMREFIEHHPESPKVKSGWFYLGKSNFRKKKYEETIQYLEKMEVYDLSSEELAEYYFKRGYSYFDLKNYTKAKQTFTRSRMWTLNTRALPLIIMHTLLISKRIMKSRSKVLTPCSKMMCSDRWCLIILPRSISSRASTRM